MVGGTNSMVGYHLMDEGHSIKLGVRVGWGGGGCEPPSRSRAAPWWGLELFYFFYFFFEYRP